MMGMEWFDFALRKPGSVGGFIAGIGGLNALRIAIQPDSNAAGDGMACIPFVCVNRTRSSVRARIRDVSHSKLERQQSRSKVCVASGHISDPIGSLLGCIGDFTHSQSIYQKTSHSSRGKLTMTLSLSHLLSRGFGFGAASRLFVVMARAGFAADGDASLI